MATECWPDRTPGDNRMWFEAETEKKERKKLVSQAKSTPE